MSRMLRNLESPGKSFLLLCVVTCPVSGPIRAGNFGQECPEFVRGDHNNDRIVDASDAVFLLGYVLRGGSGSIPFCLQSSDANDDGLVTIGDALAIMRFIRLGLQLPEPSCPFDTESGPCPTGVDPTPDVVTVPDTRDSRYEFAIGSAIGFPGEEGIHILTFTLLGGGEPPCWQGADVNNDRRIDISGVVHLMSYLFRGSAEPSEPFPNKGPALVGPEELPCDL